MHLMYHYTYLGHKKITKKVGTNCIVCIVIVNCVNAIAFLALNVVKHGLKIFYSPPCPFLTSIKKNLVLSGDKVSILDVSYVGNDP